ncbi:MAG: hypothetical protein J5564_04810 [Clostridia bacterium]|nr:hypothetical protein [Clostridia bacterium]
MLKDKKTLFRLIAFLAAVAAAVIAFTTGILQIGHRDPGYYDVGYSDPGKAEVYGSGIHLLYYEEGASSTIRLHLNEVQKAFTASLQRAWRLTDPDQTYEGIVNIASLNHSPGQMLEIGGDLQAILADALGRTQRGEGYSLLAGPLYREWQSLLYLDEPNDFDPLYNADEARRLSALTEWVNRPDACSLSLENGMAGLMVSTEYVSFLSEEEVEWPVLDLNLMRDAYLMDLVARDLRSQGYIDAYLYSDSGCSLWLQHMDTHYTLYGCDGEKAMDAGILSWSSPSSFCQFTAFSLREDGYGYYRAGDSLRHPFVSVMSGMPENVLQALALAGGEEELTDLAYQTAILCMQPDRAGVQARLDALPDNVFYACTYMSEPDSPVIRPDMEERVRPAE